MVGEDSEIHWKNGLAGSIIEGSTVFEQESKYLKFTNDYNANEFSLLINSCGTQNKTMIVSNDGSSPILLRAKELASDADRYFSIEFVKTDGFHLKYDEIAEVFNVTPTECTILTKLVGGKTVDDIADIHGQSVETIRSHVRHAYAKLKVNSREALFHKLQPFIY